jgi:predicted nucleotidyltransferase
VRHPPNTVSPYTGILVYLDPGNDILNPMSDLEKFLANTLAILQKDQRILGVAVAGSWITGRTDQYSDLDLVIVCEDAYFEALMAERRQIAHCLGTLVASFTGEHVNEPRLLICLYDRPVLHVDLKFITLADLDKRIENPVVVWERKSLLSKQMERSLPEHPMPDLQWIEDRFWVWVHYGATKLGRGELFEVIDFLSYLRGPILGSLSLVRHGQLPRGARRLESLAPGDVAAFEQTVPSYNFDSCVAATEASIALYQKLREEMEDGNLVRRIEAESVALKYLEDVKAKRNRLPS